MDGRQTTLRGPGSACRVDIALICVALSLTHPGTAAAQWPRPPLAGADERPPEAPPSRVVARRRAPFGLTVAGTSGVTGGTRFLVTVGVEALARYRYITAGAFFEAGLLPMLLASHGHFHTIGAEAGFSLGGVAGWRADVLGVGGMHDYANVGAVGGFSFGLGGPSGGSPGVSGSTPFVGARVNLSHRRSASSPVTVGVVAFVFQDLDGRSVRAAGTSSWGSTSPGTTLGETQVGVHFRLALEAGLGD